MHRDLRLTDLRTPHIGDNLLQGAARILLEIRGRNSEKLTQAVESAPFKNRKDEMRQRLIQRAEGADFGEVTDVVGRERLLMSLYLQHDPAVDAPWLPSFDNLVADSILGLSGKDWHAGRRRLATQLFLARF